MSMLSYLCNPIFDPDNKEACCGFWDNWGCLDYEGERNDGLTPVGSRRKIPKEEINQNKVDKVCLAYILSFNPISSIVGDHPHVGIGRGSDATRGVGRYAEMEEQSPIYWNALRVGGCYRGCLECVPCGCLVNIPLDILHTICVLLCRCRISVNSESPDYV